MNAEFCMNCGSRYQYALEKPNFCSSCGGALGDVPANTSTASESIAESSEKTEGSIGVTPKISKLEYEIQKSGPQVTFGNLVAHAAKDPNEEYEKVGNRPHPPSDKNIDIQKQLLNECRSARAPQDVSE